MRHSWRHFRRPGPERAAQTPESVLGKPQNGPYFSLAFDLVHANWLKLCGSHFVGSFPASTRGVQFLQQMKHFSLFLGG